MGAPPMQHGRGSRATEKTLAYSAPLFAVKRTKAQLLALILRRLEKQHGPRPFAPRGRPLDVFVRQMLAQNTSSHNSAEGFRRLKRDLPTWQQVLEAPAAEVERAIGVCGLGKQRSQRLQAILQSIKAERGRLTLAFVGRIDRDAALSYLTSFTGVGPKTAACTLVFAFGFPIFPVDKGIARVARRLRLVGPRAAESKVVETVERGTADHPERRYPLHVLLYRHAKEVCKANTPLCDGCRLLDLCPTGQRRVRHAPAAGDVPRKRPIPLARRISAGVRRGEAED